MQEQYEIEITPEMIAAGEGPFARFDSSYDPLSVGVERVVRAVLAAGGYRIKEK